MRYERRNESVFAYYDVEGDQKVDDLAMSMLERNRITSLLPFKAERSDDEVRFRYDVTGLERLTDYLENRKNKQEVIKLLGSILDASGDAYAYLLDINMLCSDKEDVFVKNGRCLFSYVPLLNEDRFSIMGLVREILYSIRYDDKEDYSYLFDLQNAFSRGDISTISDLKKWLLIVTGVDNLSDPDSSGKEKADEVVEKWGEAENATHKTAEEALSKGIAGAEETSKEVDAPSKKDTVEGIFAEFGVPLPARKDSKKEEKKKDKGKDKDKDEEKNRVIDKGGNEAIREDNVKEKEGKKFSLFGKKDKKKDATEDAASKLLAQVEQTEESKAPSKVINDYARGDSTVLVGDNEERRAFLESTSSHERYEIQGQEAVIGSSAKTDITLSANKAVSRKHARISLEGGNYSLTGLGSTNGTFYKGRRLSPDESVALSDGDVIRLADEDFVFSWR